MQDELAGTDLNPRGLKSSNQNHHLLLFISNINICFFMMWTINNKNYDSNHKVKTVRKLMYKTMFAVDCDFSHFIYVFILLLPKIKTLQEKCENTRGTNCMHTTLSCWREYSSSFPFEHLWILLSAVFFSLAFKEYYKRSIS